MQPVIATVHEQSSAQKSQCASLAHSWVLSRATPEVRIGTYPSSCFSLSPSTENSLLESFIVEQMFYLMACLSCIQLCQGFLQHKRKRRTKDALTFPCCPPRPIRRPISRHLSSTELTWAKGRGSLFSCKQIKFSISFTLSSESNFSNTVLQCCCSFTISMLFSVMACQSQAAPGQMFKLSKPRGYNRNSVGPHCNTPGRYRLLVTRLGFTDHEKNVIERVSVSCLLRSHKSGFLDPTLCLVHPSQTRNEWRSPR